MKGKKVETKFLIKLAEAIERETPVKMEDNFREYEEWDSLVYLTVIVLIDEEYGVVIPQQDFRELATVGDILNYIKEKKG